MAFNVLDDAESARAYALGYSAGAIARPRIPANVELGPVASDAGDRVVFLGVIAACDRLRYVEGWFMGATYGAGKGRNNV